MTVSPFEWLEANYFYYRPSDLIWGGNNKRGNYLDKGFNVKILYKPEIRNLPNIAIGLDDFAGTGLFTREYMVSTMNIKNMSVSLGMGWGKFASDNTFENPLIKISEKFKYRPNNSANDGYGGTLSYNQWFRGEASLFGGIELHFPRLKNMSLKIENDPFNYQDFSANLRSDIDRTIRKKDKDINIGISLPINKFITIDASYIKGNAFNLSFNMAITFNEELRSKPSFNPTIKKSTIKNDKKSFYDDLLSNLNSNNLYLQTAKLDNKNLKVSISSSEHRNSMRSASYAAYISKQVSDLNDIDLSIIDISHINAGIQLNEISFIANHLDENSSVPVEVVKYYTDFNRVEPNDYLTNEFKPTVNFPAFFSSLSPTIVSHIGNPEKFFYGGLSLQFISEVQFKRNIILSSELNYSLYNNVTDTISGPGSEMQHVRTDIVQYLKNDGFYISAMQLDYIWSPKKNLYAKISGGIFERMYGGIGTEFLYKPFDKNFTVGLELFKVKQRSFDQDFSFQDYTTTTGHLNLSYILPLGIEANLSFGRYLAKDDGYTFDLSRRTKSGFKSGIYFTRTDVPKELFGEGSFDKGFYFQIPMDLISKNYRGNYSTFKLSPLTRDGGAKLLHQKDLKGLIHNSSLIELNRNWNGFLN